MLYQTYHYELDLPWGINLPSAAVFAVQQKWMGHHQVSDLHPAPPAGSSAVGTLHQVSCFSALLVAFCSSSKQVSGGDVEPDQLFVCLFVCVACCVLFSQQVVHIWECYTRWTTCLRYLLYPVSLSKQLSGGDVRPDQLFVGLFVLLLVSYTLRQADR